MLCLDALLHKKNLLFLFIFFLSILKHSDCECVQQKKNPCECVFTNGSVIDLSSLGNEDNTPRFQSEAEMKDNFTYFYNPCYSFTLGPVGSMCAKGVSICQVSEDKQYYNLGNTDSMNFHLDSNDKLTLVYSAPLRMTNVTLVCSEDAVIPELTVTGEKVKTHYVMTLKSRCACPDLCRASHLSTGSVLVIIFMIFVSLYLFLGIIHSSLTRGAHGWELIPHYEFWADFPLLVRDGCVFVVSGCKPETAYERI